MADTLSIVLLVHNRPRLTRQALESLGENTRGEWNLTIVDDGSGRDTLTILSNFFEQHSYNCGIVPLRGQGPGPARNHGVAESLHMFGRSGLLYLCDNDCWFSPGWDTILLQCWEGVRSRFKGPLALGGYCHPFQQRGALLGQPDTLAEHSVREVEALGLLSWLMEWETWDRFGPLDPSPTINGSEDWLLSQKIRQAGGKVGVIEPAVVVNTGMTGSDGRLSPGAELIWKQAIPEGVLIE